MDVCPRPRVYSSSPAISSVCALMCGWWVVIFILPSRTFYATIIATASRPPQQEKIDQINCWSWIYRTSLSTWSWIDKDSLQEDFQIFYLYWNHIFSIVIYVLFNYNRIALMTSVSIFLIPQFDSLG